MKGTLSSRAVQKVSWQLAARRFLAVGFGRLVANPSLRQLSRVVASLPRRF
jgi:hypothetical protein